MLSLPNSVVMNGCDSMQSPDRDSKACAYIHIDVPRRSSMYITGRNYRAGLERVFQVGRIGQLSDAPHLPVCVLLTAGYVLIQTAHDTRGKCCIWAQNVAAANKSGPGLFQATPSSEAKTHA